MHFHPLFGAMVVPGVALGGMFILPYLNRTRNPKACVVCSVRGRWQTGFSFLLGVVGTVGLVLLDEFWLDLPKVVAFSAQLHHERVGAPCGFVVAGEGHDELIKSLQKYDL